METRSKRRARVSVERDDMATRSRATLTTLPNEIIFIIAGYLDNKSWARLAMARRAFLHEFARYLDPWNPVRKRLTDLDGCRCFAAMQRRWFTEHDMSQSDYESLDDFGLRVIETPTLLHALLDYTLLDMYRVRSGHVRPLDWTFNCPDLLQALSSAYRERDPATARMVDGFPIEFDFTAARVLDEEDDPKCEVCGEEHGLAIKYLREPLGNAALPLAYLDLSHRGNDGPMPMDWHDSAVMASLLEGLRLNRSLYTFSIDHETLSDKCIADMINAFTGCAHLYWLTAGLRGPESANALARLLRDDTLIRLEYLYIRDNSDPHNHIEHWDTLGAVVAAKKTLDTVGFDNVKASADVESFLEGFRDVDLGCSALMYMEIDEESLEMGEYEKERLQAVFKTMTEGRVRLAFY